MVHNRKISLEQNLDNFDLGKTKKNINIYFENLERLKWEQAKLNAGQGLTTNCSFSLEHKHHPYIRVGRDEFNLSAIENTSEEIAKHLTDFYWAQSILSKEEQLYITEYFINGKYEDEVIGLLGFNTRDNSAFRKLKRREIYKFAYVLDLIV